jgi:hypothetical protein
MATLLPGQLYPESKDYLQQQLKTAQPIYDGLETFTNAYRLSDLDDTSSSLANVYNSFKEDGEKIPAKELNTLFNGANFYESKSLTEAKRIYQRQQEKQKLQQMLQRSPNDFLNTAFKYAGSIAGGLSAADVAVGLVVAPFAPGATPAMNFLASNVIENVITEVPQGLSRRIYQERYKDVDSVFNVVQNTAIQQGLYGAAKGIQALLGRRTTQKALNTEAIASDLGKDVKAIEYKPITSSVEYTKGFVDPRSEYNYRELDAFNFADREYFKLKGKLNENGVENFSEEFAISSGFKKPVFFTDNFNAIKEIAKETTGKNKFEIQSLEFRKDANYNLLDTTRALETFNEDVALIGSINKNFGIEFLRNADGKQTLQQLLDTIEEKAKTDPDKVKNFYSDLQEKGYEGIKFSAGEGKFKTNAVALFDADNLKVSSVVEDTVEYGREFIPTGVAREMVENLNSHKSNYDYSPQGEKLYDETPDRIMEKTGQEVTR